MNHVCNVPSKQVIIHLSHVHWEAHNSLKLAISFSDNTARDNYKYGAWNAHFVVKRQLRSLGRGDKITVILLGAASWAAAKSLTKFKEMASASLLKSSPVLDKSEWVKGQALRQPPVSHVHCIPTSPSALTVRASAYADELVKTAVCIYIYL